METGEHYGKGGRRKTSSKIIFLLMNLVSNVRVLFTKGFLKYIILQFTKLVIVMILTFGEISTNTDSYLFHTHS